MSQEVFEALTQALERGEDAALVTIVSANGSTPQRVGAKMLVFPDGRTVGTIGGGCYENDAFWKAKESIQSRKPASGQIRPQRRLRAGKRTGVRRADAGLHRAARSDAAPVRHRRRPRRLSPGASRAHDRIPHARARRPREVRQQRALPRRPGSDRRNDSRVAASRRSPHQRLRRHRDARTHARSRRAARARRARPALSRT